jgi:hypothetical protein
MEMEQMRRQIREMLAVRQALISRGELEEAAHYAKMEPSWARLQTKTEEVMKVKQDKPLMN